MQINIEVIAVSTAIIIFLIAAFVDSPWLLMAAVLIAGYNFYRVVVLGRDWI